MFDFARRPALREQDEFEIHEPDCTCCATVWDHNHKHHSGSASYGDYFRWLELRVREGEPCPGRAAEGADD